MSKAERKIFDISKDNIYSTLANELECINGLTSLFATEISCKKVAINFSTNTIDLLILEWKRQKLIFMTRKVFEYL